ncbi:hypothetical protein TNCV_2973551 [Trichonephila clavipes]|nr:hypothetical protein TNCV_2973551 [Trichonephila clavipes]
MSSFLVLGDGDTRNRWRDGQVCPDVGQGTMAPRAIRLGCVLACYAQIGRGRSRETFERRETGGERERRREERGRREERERRREERERRRRRREETEKEGESRRREKRRERGREVEEPALYGEKG